MKIDEKFQQLKQDQKREIYTEEYSNAKNKLTDLFGKKMANKVMSLSNKARKEADTKQSILYCQIILMIDYLKPANKIYQCVILSHYNNIN